MSKRMIAVFTYILCITCGAHAEIVVWDGIGGCNPNHIQNTVEITQAGSFGFRAERDGQLAEIQNIWINSNVTGDVKVTIAYDENGGAGATQIWEMDLKTGESTGYLMRVNCEGAIGQENKIMADYFGDGLSEPGIIYAGGVAEHDVEFDGGIGYILIQGDCVGNLSLGEFNGCWEKACQNPYHGDITINGHLLGDLTAGSPHNVTITGTGEHTGNIYFNGNTEEQMKRRYLALRCFVWVALGDQSPKPPGIYRFEASPKEGERRAGMATLMRDCPRNLLQLHDLSRCCAAFPACARAKRDGVAKCP